MGAGIVVIIAAVAAGAALIAAPRRIWWLTESWKFRHPEANEPSDVSYGLTRAGGVVLIVIGLVSGGAFIAEDRGRVAEERARQEAEQAEAAFVPPPPERRGRLPVVGYTVDPVPAGTAVDVFYLAPDAAVPDEVRTIARGGRFTFPCYTTSTVTNGAGGRADVSVELIWAPQRLADVQGSDDCRFGRSHNVYGADRRLIEVAPDLVTVHTDSSIARVDYTEVTPAGPDNVVPRLDAEPNTNTSRQTVYDRGAIPIVGYATRRMTDGSVQLDIAYVEPKDADAVAGGVDEGPPRGCEVTPFVTGLGTATVTVNLRLRWSADRYHNAEDDKRCALGASWSEPMTITGGAIAPGTTVLTDGPIVNTEGFVQVSAAPGNRVPER